MSQFKNREEFERGLEKRKGKGGKEEKKENSDKTHVKIPLSSLNDRKKSTKQGRILEGGGIFLAGQNIIFPCNKVNENGMCHLAHSHLIHPSALPGFLFET